MSEPTATPASSQPADDSRTQGTPPAQPETDSADSGQTDYKAEAEKYKAIARKQEERAKANAKAAEELERLRSATQTDQEKAIAAAQAEARATGRAEGQLELAQELVQARLEALLSDSTRDLTPERKAGLIEHVQAAQYLSDDGKVDREALTKYADLVAPRRPDTGNQQQQWPNLGQGSRGGAPAPAGARGLEMAKQMFPERFATK